jgi:hypothetical protein
MALTESLYNVVRAFESTLFRQVNINWSLDVLGREINTLLSKEPLHTWDDDDVAKRVKSLKPLFTANLRTIRTSLLSDLSGIALKDHNVHFTIDAATEGTVLDDLNAGLNAQIDTLRLGVIEPEWEHQMMADLTLRGIVFAEGEQIPKAGDASIIVEISDLGIVRAGSKLLGLRLAAPIAKTFRYHFANSTIEKEEESEFSKDLMKLIFEDADDKVRQKLAMPSAWTDLTLRATFNLRGTASAPKIERLDFSMKVGRLLAPPQVILEARSSDAFSPITLDGKPHTELYRILNRSGETVELTVDPKPANGVKFKQWEIRQGGKKPWTVSEPRLKLELKTHARVEAQFVPV